MKKSICIWMVLAMVLLAGCAKREINNPLPPTVVSENPSQEPSETIDANYFGKLYVKGADLVANNGALVQLKGVSSHNLSVFPQFVNKESMQQLKEQWGCNVFRLAMYTAEANGYCIGDDANKDVLKERIDAAVMDAEAAQMYIIIDWHILSDGNPLLYQEEAISFFKEMAQKYSGKNHVIFEICNEPNGDTTWADVQAYARAVIPVIREFSDAVILVGTPSWSKSIESAVAEPLAEYANIMYTLHFYAATHKGDLREQLQAAIRAKLPVFVSEFGISEATGTGATDEAEANVWLALLNEHNISYVMWSLSNKDESSAIINLTSDKTSGFNWDDLSQTGRWFVNAVAGMKENVPLPSESYAPAANGSVQVNMVSSWEVKGEHFYKYIVQLRNNTDVDISPWEVVLEFNQPFSLSEAWGGEYAVTDNTLSITAKHYNTVLYANTTTTEVGFIVKSKEALTATKSILQ